MILGVVINKNYWPTPGRVRQYLHDVPRPRTVIPVIKPPESPLLNGPESMNGLVDPDITVIFSRRQKARDENS
jgi:hypothetical protein